MKVWLDSSYLISANQSYIELLYKDFLMDSESVDFSWRKIFEQLVIKDVSFNRLNSMNFKKQKYLHHLSEKKMCFNSLKNQNINFKQIKVFQLIDSFRFHGHQQASLDPLKLWKQKILQNLNPIFYNFTESDFQEIFNVGSFAAGCKTMKLMDLYNALKKTYCGNFGIEYMYITSSEEKFWIQQRVESVMGQPNFSSIEKKRFLDELTAAEGIEKYLGAKFPGAKRFSLEGGDALIPMLKEIIRYASNSGTREIVLGMAHRGRLNVLINVLGKKPQDLFDEFSSKPKEYLGTGDVKYHQGFSSDIETKDGIVHLTLMFNPSHLEIVNPVVMGSVRARIDRLKGKNNYMILPVTLHGDAAISGQGVVQETMNMSKVRGYDVGGTVHIVINNQIGFTTSNIYDARSTRYCTDIAKMIQVPIFHVNADDLESVIFITHIALDFRNIFKRDIIIDLVCYRRHGHNEADEPSVTQPLMYQKIKKHPSLRKIYADYLEHEGIIMPTDAIEMINTFQATLDRGECTVKEWRQMNSKSFAWRDYLDHNWDETYLSNIDINYLQKLACSISTIPSDVELHPRVKKIYHNRTLMAHKKRLFDWGSAEMLAYATLVDIGIPVRLSGEDTARGTFFHRHAVVHDQKNGSTYIPLNHIHEKQEFFCVFDSVLSEEAVLAFEYGYSTAEPRSLVIWEAQFGDFANGAQVVIDQFISSGEQKWGRMCGLVMLLPHGYEGQGPEHSSARLERYLQLCAEQNMQVCIPSTSAQIYHMLRRQALRNMRRPLIVMSPKSLLRHPLSSSSLDELANGTFYPVINEIDNLNPQNIKRVIICSGKVYYDLLEERRKNKQQNVAIIRIEQLYPFPIKDIRKVMVSYGHVKDFIWCQEEPQNQGAWYYSQHYFRDAIPTSAMLNYVGRKSSASPSVGYSSIHQIQQKKLVYDALNFK